MTLKRIIGHGMFWNVCWGIIFIAFAGADEEIRIEPGVPLPHAEELEQIVKRQLFPNKTDDQSFLELYGDITEVDNETLVKLENLEFNVLDRASLKTMINISRRIELEDDPPLDYADAAGNSSARRTGLFLDYVLIPKIYNMMKHGIYGTRYRMEKTRDIRKRFHTDEHYKMGFMFGNILELRSKAANAFKTMMNLDKYSGKFIWFMVLYERILALHVDVTSAVNRMFAIREQKLKRDKEIRDRMNQAEAESER